MRAVAARPTLLVPRVRPGRAVDVATRETFIAKQRGRRRHLRRLRRALRFAGAGLTTGLVFLALAITGATAAYALRTTPLLAVSEVTVVGARRIPEAVVRSAAGIEPGANLLVLDLAAVADRVEALPGVRHARAVRHLPSRLEIWLQEREPYALVSTGGARSVARLSWVDADGRLVGLERHGTLPPLPILTGVEAPPTDAEQPVGDRLQLGLTLLRALQRAGGRVVTRISEIDVERPEAPVLYTVDGVVVWLGSERWDERLARLDGVLGELEEQRERVESVDLRYRDLVVLKPREKGR
jgi:cell division septal protein FtsQ